MTTVVIVIHLMVVLAMIGLVLLQRSEGGALGIGGGQGAFLSGRSAGNVLTRSTAILALVFFTTSLGLALIAKYQSRPSDIFDRLPGQTQSAPAKAPAAPAGAEGGAPTSAEDVLKQLNAGSSSAGPQTPPAAGATAPSTPPPSPAPAANAPAPAPATSAPAPAPATSAPAPAPAAPTP